MKAFHIVLASAAITAVAIKAAPALAQPAAPTVTVVHTADLDLSSDAGRRQLDQRLVVAAHEVCGAASTVDLAGKNRVRTCRHNVLSEARAKSGALIASRGGGTILLASTR